MISVRWITQIFRNAMGPGCGLPVISVYGDTMPALPEIIDGRVHNRTLRTAYARSLKEYEKRIRDYALIQEIQYYVPALQRVVTPTARRAIFVNALGFLLVALSVLCRDRGSYFVDNAFPLQEAGKG